MHDLVVKAYDVLLSLLTKEQASCWLYCVKSGTVRCGPSGEERRPFVFVLFTKPSRETTWRLEQGWYPHELEGTGLREKLAGMIQAFEEKTADATKGKTNFFINSAIRQRDQLQAENAALRARVAELEMAVTVQGNALYLGRGALRLFSRRRASLSAAGGV